MAKSKIKFEWTEDIHRRRALKVERKRGKLTWSEVLETLYDSGLYEGFRFVLEVHVTDTLPYDLYDEGDVWLLYQPDDYLGKKCTERLRPMKPVMVAETKEGKRMGTCPTCSGDVKRTGINDQFCTCCGQKLDWRTDRRLSEECD